jgi:hypothetical protein
MKKLKIFIILITTLFLTSCLIQRRDPCSHKKPLFKKYQPRLQGGAKWNYKKYMGPKRKVK